MNDQQRAAMTMALEALEEATKYTAGTDWSPSMTIECVKSARALREALAQLQDHSGEATDMVDGVDLASAWAEGYETGINDERESEANIGIAGFNAKINPNRQNPYGKNTPPVVPQGEPVVWVWLDDWMDGGYPEDCFSRVNHQEKVPLYTAPPSVETIRIETLEKAADLREQIALQGVQSSDYEDGFFDGLAAYEKAIRSMK